MIIGKIFKKDRENENDISIKEIDGFIKKNIDFILLDVRSYQEYAEGHLRRLDKYSTLRNKKLY